MPLLVRFTTTGPEPLRPLGAFKTSLVGLHDVTKAGAPLNVTIPNLVPKPVPVTVTLVKGGPEVGLMDVTTGGATEAAHPGGPSTARQTTTSRAAILASLNGQPTFWHTSYRQFSKWPG